MNFETSISRRADIAYEDQQTTAQSTRRLLIIAVVGLLVILGILAWRMMQPSGIDPNAKSANQSPTVSVIQPGRVLVEGAVSATGTLAARREMPVGATGEGGLVSKVWVEPGSWVQAGQVLASIERSVQNQQSNQLAAQIGAVQADARLAQNELERSTALLKRGFVSKADIDRKTAQRDAAVARVRVAQAQLAENRARVGRLDIRAPAAGLVLTRSVEPGQVVSAGSGVLFRLARGGEMELKAELSETDLARMAVGQAAKVTPIGTATVFNGQIWQLPPVIDPVSRHGIVRIALAYNSALRPGGFASAAIVSGTAELPLLPESAVLSDQKGNFVYLVDAKGKIVRRDVKTGANNEKGVTVVEGLTGEELVVLSAGGFLNPGETVIAKRINAEAR
jgi:HlyD family secretion protein